MKDNYCLFLLPGIGTTPVDSEMRRHADLVPAVYYDTRSPTHTHTPPMTDRIWWSMKFDSFFFFWFYRQLETATTARYCLFTFGRDDVTALNLTQRKVTHCIVVLRLGFFYTPHLVFSFYFLLLIFNYFPCVSFPNSCAGQDQVQPFFLKKHRRIIPITAWRV